MMNKELKESLSLSSKYVRAYGEDALQESAATSESEDIEDEPEHERQTPSHTTSQDAQQIYAIRDVWYALSTAMGIALMVTIGVGILFAMALNPQLSLMIGLVFGIYAGRKTWNVHQPGVVIDLTAGTVSFAAEDVENTLREIITLKKFFNHWQRISIPLREILRIDNDTLKIGRGKNAVKHYGLNVSGTFGSQQIVFTKKQKRDECRALLALVLKKMHNNNAKFDFNLNTGLSNDGQ